MANKYHCQGHHHFLIVILAAQGHINPARNLARQLARIARARITIANPLSSHRRLFPASSAAAGEPDDNAEETPLNPDGSGVVAYSPYSDGFDDNDRLDNIDADLLMERLKTNGSHTLSILARNLAARGRPVTCLLYTIILSWTTDIARDLGIPAVHYWIQPASVFAIYYHYFHNHPGFSSVSTDGKDSAHAIELPGLLSLRMKDLPSIITNPNAFLNGHIDIFNELGKSKKPMVLFNTFNQLEADAIDGIHGLELFTIGPVVNKNYIPESVGNRDLFVEDAGDYMEWLNAQEERSVVYVAFGSATRMTGRQVKEMYMGLKESGMPYLWVLRKDSRPEGVEVEMVLKDRKGMVVEWCSQVRVLDHKSVGCFVTHCGWNSMSEAVVSGVPMVMLPGWIDQMTNARLGEMVWGIGVTVEGGEDGVLEAKELRRGLDAVMGEGDGAVRIRSEVERWKEKARAAIGEEGSSCENLKAFVRRLCEER